MRRRRDRLSLVAGLAVSGLGVLVLLDRAGAIDLRFGYALPLALGVRRRDHARRGAGGPA